MVAPFPDNPLGMALFAELLNDLDDDEEDGDGGSDVDDEDAGNEP
jgi:hypothetical protein